MDAKPKSMKRGPAIAVLAVPLLLAGYVASSGPAARVLEGKTWVKVFAPVYAAYDSWRTAREFVKWYLSLWGCEVASTPDGISIYREIDLTRVRAVHLLEDDLPLDR